MKIFLNQNYYKICRQLTPKLGLNTYQSSYGYQKKSLLYLKNTNKQIKGYSSLITNTKYQFSENNKPDLGKILNKNQAFKKSQEQLMNADPDEDPYTYKSKGGSGRYVFGAGVLFITGIIIYAEYKMRKDNQAIVQQNISGLQTVAKSSKTKIGGDWNLIDMHGNKFSSNDLSGSYYIIYFGFTKCPDICPATLYKMSRVLKYIQRMPEAQYMNLKLVFVSVDPDRDQPAKIKNYLKNFDSKIIGVTGLSNQDQDLKDCMKKFKIYTNKIELANKDYSIDHTTISYLMDDTNQYMDYLNPNLTQQQLAKFLVNQILLRDQKKMKQKQKVQQKI